MSPSLTEELQRLAKLDRARSLSAHLQGQRSKTCPWPQGLGKGWGVPLGGVCVLLRRVPLFATPWTVYSLPGSSIHGILQARILEWVAREQIFQTLKLLQSLS